MQHLRNPNDSGRDSRDASKNVSHVARIADRSNRQAGDGKGQPESKTRSDETRELRMIPEMIKLRMIQFRDGKHIISFALCRDIIRNLAKKSELRLAILDSVWSRYKYRREVFDRVCSVTNLVEEMIMND